MADEKQETPTTDDPYLDDQARRYIDYRKGEKARHRWRIMTGQPRPEERSDPIRRALWDQIIELEAIDQKAAAEAAKSGRVSTATWGNFFLGWVKLQAAGIQGKSEITAAQVAEQGKQIKIAFDLIAEQGPLSPDDLPPDILKRTMGYQTSVSDRSTGEIRPGAWAELEANIRSDLAQLSRDPRLSGAYMANLRAQTGIDIVELLETPMKYTQENAQSFQTGSRGLIAAAEQAQVDAEGVLLDQLQSIKASADLIEGAGVSVPGGGMFNAFANVVMDEFPGLRDQFVKSGILSADDADGGKAPTDPRSYLAPAKEKLYAELEALGASTEPLSVETFRLLVSSQQFQSWVIQRKYGNLPPKEQFQAFLTEWRASNSSERGDSRRQQDETILSGKVPFSRLQVGMAKIRQWFRDQKARRNGGEGKDGQSGSEKATGSDITADGKPPSDSADVQPGGRGGKGASPADDVAEQTGTDSGWTSGADGKQSRMVGDADTISSSGPGGQRTAWKRTGPIQTSPDGNYIFNGTAGILWKKGSDGKLVPTARRDGDKFVPLNPAEVNAAQAKTPPEERSADPAATAPKTSSEAPSTDIAIQPSASAAGGSTDDVLPPGAEDMNLAEGPALPEGWTVDAATGDTVTDTGYRLTPDGGMKDPSGRAMTSEEVQSFLVEDAEAQKAQPAQSAAPKLAASAPASPATPKAGAQTKPPTDAEVQGSVASEVYQAKQEKKGEEAGGGPVEQVDPEVDELPVDRAAARERAAELALGGGRAAADAERANNGPFPDEQAYQQQRVVPPGGAGVPMDRKSVRKRGKWETPPVPSEEGVPEAGSQGKALMQQQMLAAKSPEEQARLKRKYQTLYGLTGVG